MDRHPAAVLRTSRRRPSLRQVQPSCASRTSQAHRAPRDHRHQDRIAGDPELHSDASRRHTADLPSAKRPLLTGPSEPSRAAPLVALFVSHCPLPQPRFARPQPIVPRPVPGRDVAGARTVRDLGPLVANDRHPDLASMLTDNVAGKGCHLVVAAQRPTSSGALGHAHRTPSAEHLRATRKSCGGSNYRRIWAHRRAVEPHTAAAVGASSIR